MKWMDESVRISSGKFGFVHGENSLGACRGEQGEDVIRCGSQNERLIGTSW